MELVTPANSCWSPGTVDAPERLRLPTGKVLSGHVIQGTVVMERDDAGVATHTVEMRCTLKRRGGYITMDGGFSPFGDGGNPDDLLCDCTNLGVPIRDGSTLTVGYADAGPFACDYFMDTDTGP